MRPLFLKVFFVVAGLMFISSGNLGAIDYTQATCNALYCDGQAFLDLLTEDEDCNPDAPIADQPQKCQAWINEYRTRFNEFNLNCLPKIDAEELDPPGIPPQPKCSGIAPSPSTSVTPRPKSDPAENPEVCIVKQKSNPLIFSCILSSENATDCSTYPQCKSADVSCERGPKSECEKAAGPAFETRPTIPPPESGDALGVIVEQIYRWSLRIIGLAVLIVFIYGGVMYLAAAGLPSQVNQAKSMMTNAIWGALLLLSAYLILNTINPDFVRQSSTLPPLPTPEQSSAPRGLFPF